MFEERADLLEERDKTHLAWNNLMLKKSFEIHLSHKPPHINNWLISNVENTQQITVTEIDLVSKYPPTFLCKVYFEAGLLVIFLLVSKHYQTLTKRSSGITVL